MNAEADLRFNERIDPVVVEILRRKTPGERMRMALEANEFVRAVVTATLRRNHPQWNEDEIRKQLIRRVLGDSTRLIEARV